ncbi:MAG TPA: hypothetical protein VM536_07495, partial [Chloroflexia bacterium]|nr:hypothetical protein [Chloroflexia bacterium]
FDDEYYHNMTWAHLASGGAGTGLRWPCRNPHHLTPGMHATQRGMARFCSHIDWAHFPAQPLDHALRVVTEPVGYEYQGGIPRLTVLPLLPARAYGMSDGQTGFLWVVRDSRAIGPAEPLDAPMVIGTGWDHGWYDVEFYHPASGERTGGAEIYVWPPPQDTSLGTALRIPLPLDGPDLALIIRKRA